MLKDKLEYPQDTSIFDLLDDELFSSLNLSLF
jgi:hypothetical protein